MSFLPPANAGQRGDGHLTALIAAGMLLGATTANDDELKDAITHALGCHECQVALVVLAATLATADDTSAQDRAEIDHLLDQLAEALHERTFAGDNELYSAYAEAVVRMGEEQARQRFPLVARHLDHCARCTADTAEFIEVLRDMVAAGIISFPTRAPASAPAAAATAVAPPESIWQRESQRVQRLREKLAIIVGQATITVISALPELRPQPLTAGIAGLPGFDVPSDAGTLRDAGMLRGAGMLRDAGATLQKDERLTFTMRPGATPPTSPGDGVPWLRIMLDLHARANHVVKLALSTHAVAAGDGAPPDAEAAGQPWPGISWRIEYPDGEKRRVLASDVTDSQGEAVCNLTLVGEHELMVSDGVETWVIPLDVRHQPLA